MGTGVWIGDVLASGEEIWAEASVFAGDETEEEERAWAESVTAKRRGEVAEAAFVAKAARMGFAVAKPWGDSDRYDFIVDTGDRLRRVQVKSAFRPGEDGGYSFHAHGHTMRAYGADEIDALVAYVVPENAWYVFPVRLIQKLRSMKLFPGSRRKRSRFERFREAWWVLRGKRPR